MGQTSVTTPNMVEIAGRAPTVDQKNVMAPLEVTQ